MMTTMLLTMMNWMMMLLIDDYNNVCHNVNDHQDDDNDVGGDIELLSNSNVRDCFSKPSNAVTT